MAHQAHAIPWNTLASNFVYIENPKGPKYPDLWSLHTPGQVKQLRYFTKTFEKNIKQYAKTERRKYRSIEEYRKRAESWTLSEKEAGDSMIDTAICAEMQSSDELNQHVPKITKRSQIVDQRTAELGCKSQPETRKVFSDTFKDCFKGRIKDQILFMRFELAEMLQYIENWPISNGRLSSPGLDLPKEQGERSDIIKLLMMEAAAMRSPLTIHQRDSSHIYCLETLFLLSHHQDKFLVSFDYLWVGCCHTECGIQASLGKAIKLYLFLNLIFAMTENGSEICKSTSIDNFLNLVDHQGNYSQKNNLKLTPTPKARYMNTPTWHRLVKNLIDNHQDHPEVLIYEPLFFPRVTDKEGNVSDERIELDIMADHHGLRELLSRLWKMMINYEMLQVEMGISIDWDYLIVKMLDELFPYTPRPITLESKKDDKHLFGMPISEYEEMYFGR